MTEAEFLRIFIDRAAKNGRLDHSDCINFIREFEPQHYQATAEADYRRNFAGTS